MINTLNQNTANTFSFEYLRNHVNDRKTYVAPSLFLIHIGIKIVFVHFHGFIHINIKGSPAIKILNIIKKNVLNRNIPIKAYSAYK